VFRVKDLFTNHGRVVPLQWYYGGNFVVKPPK